MKLTNPQQAAVTQQTGAEAIAEDNPAMKQLEEIFGEHTFYLGADGLFVPEVIGDPETARNQVELVRVAKWTSDQRESLQPAEPERTGFVLALDSDSPANDADPAA